MKLASLQYHFPNKADLMPAILNHTMDAYPDEVETAIPRPGMTWWNNRKARPALSGIGTPDEDDGRLEIHL